MARQRAYEWGWHPDNPGRLQGVPREGSDVADTDLIGHLTVEQAAPLLGASYETLRTAARLGLLKAEKASGRWWFRSEVIENVRQVLDAEADEYNRRRPVPGRPWRAVLEVRVWHLGAAMQTVLRNAHTVRVHTVDSEGRATETAPAEGERILRMVFMSDGVSGNEQDQ